MILYLLIGFYLFTVLLSGYVSYIATRNELILNDGVILLSTLLYRLFFVFMPFVNLSPPIYSFIAYVISTEVKFNITKDKNE